MEFVMNDEVDVTSVAWEVIIAEGIERVPVFSSSMQCAKPDFLTLRCMQAYLSRHPFMLEAAALKTRNNSNITKPRALLIKRKPEQGRAVHNHDQVLEALVAEG